MCNRYSSPEETEVERFWHVGRGNQPPLWPRGVYPRSPGPFIRASSDTSRELVIGQWALVPKHSPTNPPKSKTGKPLSTNNARSEELHWKQSYKDAWARGQRCIIPAASFDEPNWESGKNVWWQFRRADGNPWGLAGIWETWISPETGEMVETYSMLTLNADAHPLMNRMHKPDPKFAPDKQDKRSVIPIELGDVDAWLSGTIEEAKSLLRLAPVEVFDAGPAIGPPPPALPAEGIRLL